MYYGVYNCNQVYTNYKDTCGLSMFFAASSSWLKRPPQYEESSRRRWVAQVIEMSAVSSSRRSSILRRHVQLSSLLYKRCLRRMPQKNPFLNISFVRY